jgi:hemoglobin
MASKSLYERLGGYDAIAAVIDRLMEQLLADPQLSVYWKGRNNETRKRDRQLFVDFVCHATGGPVVYTGRDTKTAHDGLEISEGDWKIAADLLAGTLDELGVPDKEKRC